MLRLKESIRPVSGLKSQSQQSFAETETHRLPMITHSGSVMSVNFFYRCGGSVGFQFKIGTNFPFNPTAIKLTGTCLKVAVCYGGE